MYVYDARAEIAHYCMTRVTIVTTSAKRIEVTEPYAQQYLQQVDSRDLGLLDRQYVLY